VIAMLRWRPAPLAAVTCRFRRLGFCGALGDSIFQNAQDPVGRDAAISVAARSISSPSFEPGHRGVADRHMLGDVGDHTVTMVGQADRSQSVTARRRGANPLARIKRELENPLSDTTKRR
jgi:hypothetical protein